MSENVTNCGAIGSDALVLVYIGVPLGCLVICESVLTIVTIWRSPVLHETQYLFITSLALTDILLAVASTIGACVHLPWTQSHLHRNMLHTITFGAKGASLSVTGVHMSIIAIDRYIRIAHPFYYVQKITKQRITKILVCVYIMWIVMTFAPLVASNATNYWSCIYNTAYLEYCLANLAIVQVSVIIVFVCYFKIALIAVRHKKAAITRRHQNGANRETTVMRIGNIIMKSIKFFVTMFGVYFFCAVIPFIVYCTMFLYNIPDLAKFLLVCLFQAHCLLNFFICSRMDKRFFRALKITLIGTCRTRFLLCQRN